MTCDQLGDSILNNFRVLFNDYDRGLPNDWTRICPEIFIDVDALIGRYSRVLQCCADFHRFVRMILCLPTRLLFAMQRHTETVHGIGGRTIVAHIIDHIHIEGAYRARKAGNNKHERRQQALSHCHFFVGFIRTHDAKLGLMFYVAENCCTGLVGVFSVCVFVISCFRVVAYKEVMLLDLVVGGLG